MQDQLLLDALALHRQGQVERAMALYRDILAREPENADAHHLFGAALAQGGRHDDGIALIAMAIELNPSAPAFYQSLSTALREMGDVVAAVGCLQEAVTRFPNEASLFRILGDTCDEWEDWQAAVSAYSAAIRLDPSDVEAYRGLGTVLARRGDDQHALEAFQRGIGIDATNAPLLASYADCLLHDGRMEEARVAYEQSLQQDPDDPAARLYLLFVLQKLCAWKGIGEQWAALHRAMTARPRVPVGPFPLLSGPSSAAEQLSCAKSWAGRYGAPDALCQPLSRTAVSQTRERLHIGYLSADLRSHAVGFLVADLFEQHDRDRVTVTAYSIGANDDSPIRRRIVESVDHFHDLVPCSSVVAAQRIAADHVDILVDLTGHTHMSRSGILAQRPAAIQVNFLGYPGTMGAAFIDYILVDRFVVPPDQAPFFSERLAYLPDTYLPANRSRQIAAHVPSRVALGLPPSGFVFCCLNQTYKLTPTLFARWMRLLQHTPGSVLWLAHTNDWAVANLRAEAARAGIAPHRLLFAAKLPEPGYLARYQRADLFLDTLPYNGHSITADALWAGLPVLTCAGDTFASRVAGSLLHAVGLPELITNSLDQYEALALALARDPDRLAALRRRLATNRLAAPLFDTARFTRHLEALYTRIWDEYRRSGCPAGDTRTPLCLAQVTETELAPAHV